MPDTAIATLVDQILDLQAKYQHTQRSTLMRWRMQYAQNDIGSADVFQSPLVKETLLEHVGHLPVLAAFIHPYLELTKQVSLGHTLSILAIHDIAETVTGDIQSYRKTDTDNKRERKVAEQLLTPSQFALFNEYERIQTLEAKFAKSIDKLAPMLNNLSDSELTKSVYQHDRITKEMLLKKKQHLMEWDGVISQIFAECVRRIDPYFFWLAS